MTWVSSFSGNLHSPNNVAYLSAKTGAKHWASFLGDFLPPWEVYSCSNFYKFMSYSCEV